MFVDRLIDGGDEDRAVDAEVGDLIAAEQGGGIGAQGLTGGDTPGLAAQRGPEPVVGLQGIAGVLDRGRGDQDPGLKTAVRAGHVGNPALLGLGRKHAHKA